MLNVDIICREMIELQGANRVTEKLIQGINFFNNNNINLRYLYTNQGKTLCSHYVSRLGVKTKREKAIDNIKAILKKIPLYNFVCIKWLLEQRRIKDSKKALNYYYKNNEKADCIKVVVEVSPDFYRPTDVVNLLGDPAKAKRVLGWDPDKTSFEELVKIMTEHDIKKVAAER